MTVPETTPEVVDALARVDVGGGTPLGEIIARKVVKALGNIGYALVRDDGWHYVTFDEDGWFIEHSVACRQAGTLGTCDFNRAIREIADEPDLDLFGRHRITEVDSEGLPSLERAGG